MTTKYARPAAVALALIAGGLGSSTAHAQTTATWSNPVDGNWTDASKWSTNPIFPNNSGPNTYNVFLDQSGAPYVVSLDQAITITDFHLTSPDAALDLTTNNLIVGGDYFQSGGQVRGPITTGTVTVAGTATFSGAFTAEALDGVSSFISQNTMLILPTTTIEICDTEVFHDGFNCTWGSGDIHLNEGGHFHEGAAGTFNITSDGTFAYTGLGAQTGFLNAGMIRKSAGSGVTFFSGVDLDNTGTVQVETGTLRADRPVQVSGPILTGGTWKVLGGSALDLVGAALTTNRGDVTLDGAGSSFAALESNLAINDTAGRITIRNGKNLTTVGSLTNNGSVTVGQGTVLTVPAASSLTNYNAGTQTLTGGTYAVSGLLRFANSGIRVVASDVTLDGAASDVQDTTSGAPALLPFNTIAPTGSFTIQNGRNFTTTAAAGDFTVAQAGAQQGTLTVGTGQLFTIVNHLTNIASGDLTTGRFNLFGTLQATGAAITTVSGSVSLNGAGVHIIDEHGVNAFQNLHTIQPTGDLSVKFGHNLTVAGDLSLRGRLGIGPDSGLDTPSIVTVNGLLTQEVGGVLDLDGGILNISPLGAVFHGTITGSGIINGDPILNGLLSPGHSLGSILIGGNLSIASGSAIDMDLGGTAAGEFDQLTILGTAAISLTGTTLNVALANGFSPSAGDVFDIILHNARSGTFETVNLPALSGGLTWDLRYQTGDVELAVVPAPGGLALGLGAMALAARRRRR